MRMDKSKFIKLLLNRSIIFLLTGCGDYEEETAQQESTAVKTDGAKQGNELETLNCDDKAPTNENVEKMSYVRKIIHRFHRIMKIHIYLSSVRCRIFISKQNLKYELFSKTKCTEETIYEQYYSLS